MKTREELEKMALKIYWHCENGEISEAIELLDNLHSEGMRDAAAIVKSTWIAMDIPVERYQVCKAQHAILSAIENKPKP